MLTAITALYTATEVSGRNMAGPPEPRITAAASPTLQTLLVNIERNQSFWDASELRKFYEQRAHRLAWADEQGAEERRAIAIRALERAWEDGLVSQDYRRGLPTVLYLLSGRYGLLPTLSKAPDCGKTVRTFKLLIVRGYSAKKIRTFRIPLGAREGLITKRGVEIAEFSGSQDSRIDTDQWP